MSFIGGLIGGAAQGVASRHLEERQNAQAQKLQDTKIQAEAEARQKQSELEEQIGTRKLANETQIRGILEGPGTSAEKKQAMRPLLKNSGMNDSAIDGFMESFKPVWALHDAAQAQGQPTSLPKMHQGGGENVSAGSPQGTVDPTEFGYHLGYAGGDHMIKGGDPKQLDLSPHIGTLLGVLARGRPGSAPGGAQDPGSPSQDPAQGAQGAQGQAPTSPNSSGSESPEAFTQRLNAGPALPALPAPGDQGQELRTSPKLEYEKALAEAHASAGSARDIAKIKAQNSEKLKLEEGQLQLMRNMQGSAGQGRPVHRYQELGANGGMADHIDAGRPMGVVSGADIEEDKEHGGEGAADIDHSPNTLYRRHEFSKAGGSEYFKVNNFGAWGPPEQNKATGDWVQYPYSKTGTRLSNEGRTVAPPASQVTRSSESTQFIRAADGSMVPVNKTTTSGPFNPQPSTPNAPGLPAMPPAPPALGTPGAPPAPPPPPQGRATYSKPPVPSAPLGQQDQLARVNHVDPDTINSLATMYQNDVTTGDKEMSTYPKQSPVRSAVMAEVARRQLGGEGPVPILLAGKDRSQVIQAQAILPHVAEAMTNVDRLAGKLGPVAGRWQDFLSGKVGGGGDPEVAQLRTDIKFLKSKISQIHFTGAAGIEAAKSFDSFVAADKMDAPTLNAGLRSMQNILTSYASIAKQGGARMAGGVGGAMPSQAAQAAKAGSLEDFKAKHGLK